MLTRKYSIIDKIILFMKKLITPKHEDSPDYTKQYIGRITRLFWYNTYMMAFIIFLCFVGILLNNHAVCNNEIIFFLYVLFTFSLEMSAILYVAYFTEKIFRLLIPKDFPLSIILFPSYPKSHQEIKESKHGLIEYISYLLGQS